jgi:hypothetical protein
VENNFNAAALAAGSELRCSVENLGHYLIALLSGGRYEGKTLISANSIQKMWKPAVTFQGGISELGSDIQTLQYGFGWFISRVDGRKIIHHGGNTLTMSSYTMIDPEKGQAVSMILNISMADPYRYSSALSVANNLLHLLSHEPLSNFGAPRDENPYAKAADLPPSQQEKYLGEYASKAGDAVMQISAGYQHDLIARLDFTTGTSMFRVLFNSPANAVLRCIAGDQPVTFRMTADGAVTGLDSPLFGALSKLPPERHAKSQRVTSPSREFSFYLPKSYKVKWEEGQFQAQSPDGRIVLTGGAREKMKDGLNSLAPSILNDSWQTKIIHEGSTHKENFAARLWWEKTLLVREKDKTLQKVIVYLENGKNAYWVMMDTPDGEATKAIREVLVPLMSDFTIMNT